MQKCSLSASTVVRIKGENLRENESAFRRDKQNCPLYTGVRSRRVSVENVVPLYCSCAGFRYGCYFCCCCCCYCFCYRLTKKRGWNSVTEYLKGVTRSPSWESFHFNVLKITENDWRTADTNSRCPSVPGRCPPTQTLLGVRFRGVSF